MKNYFALFFALIICACTSGMGLDYQHYLARKNVTLPDESSDQFTHCHGYGCKFKTQTSLTKNEWRKIESFFKPPAKTAIEEQAQIKKSIAYLEKTIGKRAGTDGDTYGTFIELGDKQLDCVDESTNTTTYLAMIENRGLLKHHTLSPPAVRLPLIHSGSWPHQSATITEISSNTQYVVDSWFHDNGFEPEIVTFKEWRNGWKPETHRRQEKQSKE